jgi:hypothetical protein
MSCVFFGPWVSSCTFACILLATTGFTEPLTLYPLVNSSSLVKHYAITVEIDLFIQKI